MARANLAPLLFNSGGLSRFAACDLSWAELRYTDLTEARLKGANLRMPICLTRI